jgi:hypothetical protein
MKAFQKFQARGVERVKRRAIRALHQTPRGEALLLQIYLWAEEGAESEALGELRGEDPAWLRKQVESHLADERKHAGWLRERLAEIGMPVSSEQAQIDRLSRTKLDRLRRLCLGRAPRFRQGLRVPTMAVAYRMEAMGVRVMERHASELRAMESVRHADAYRPTRELLERILKDERCHVAGCKGALAKLTTAEEQAELEQLLEEIDKIERAFGLTGAMGLWLAGQALKLESLALHRLFDEGVEVQS